MISAYPNTAVWPLCSPPCAIAGKVETALALSGSAAQSKIQTYPGDCDFFERVNIIAPTRAEAGKINGEPYAAGHTAAPVLERLPAHVECRVGRVIDAKGREDLMTRAVRSLPPAPPPINVVLLPMEGDPSAPTYFWRLARETGGAFLSPARAWP